MIDLFQEWAISPQHSAYARLAQSRINSGDVAGLFAMYEEDEEEEASQSEQDKVCVIKVSGVMTKTGAKCTVSMRHIIEYIKIADKNNQPIVIVWNCPGSTVMGIRELENCIENCKSPLISYIDGICASGGYWAAVKSDYIIANQLENNKIGSVGIYALHEDHSKKNEQYGIKVTYIYAGSNKIDGNPDNPLSDEVLTEMQISVNESYADFLSALSVRKISSEALTGKTYKNEKALQLGLIDELGNLDTAINHARKLALISKPL